MENMQKKKVLCLFDYGVNTGFAVVSRNIINRLHKTGKYDFDIIGINYNGCPLDRNTWPGNVYPAVIGINRRYQDFHGRQHFIDMLQQADDYDLIFIIQDTFIIEPIIDAVKESISQKTKQPPVIFYFPIDATPKKDWVETVSKCDYPVAYTQYAKNECVKILPELSSKIQVIYHGHDFKDIYPVDKKELQQFKRVYYAGKADNKFIVVNVNRNQGRKDIGRSFMILNELKKRGHKDILFYMHMAEKDAGGDLRAMAANFDLEWGEDWVSPLNFLPHMGVDQKTLNLIYNSADCFLSTTHGEGHGLTIADAVSAKVPIVIPDNTCLSELWGEGRGSLVPAGDNPSHWIIKENDNELMRPLMNVEKAADAIEHIKNGVLPDVEGAYQWLQQYSWDNVCKNWEKLFDEAQPKTIEKQPNSTQLPRAERRRLERELKKQSKKKNV